MASDSGALPTFDFDGDPPPEDTDEPQLSDGLAVAALETDWDPTNGDYIRALARKGVGPAVVGGLCVIGLLCILLVRCLCGPVGQGNAYGPQLRSKGMTTCLTLAGIVTCVIHLVFPIISGTLIVLAGLQIDSSLSGFTHTVTEQVRDIQTNVTYIRETIVSIKPDDVTLDLSPLYDAERQAADAVDVVEVWSGDARDILQGLKASFVIFGVCAIALALFGIAVLWRRTRSLLYLFFALAGAWTFIAWLLGTLGVTVRTFFRDLCDVLLLHVNGEQNAWILDTLRCRELRRGIRGLGTAMAAANAKIEDVNADIESLNARASVVPTFRNVSALCIPYRTDGEFWFVNLDNAPGCVETANVAAAYGPIVCPTPLRAGVPIEQDVDYQVCVLQNTPIPNATFAELAETSEAFVTLNRALPVIRDFARCGFVDRAFRAVLRENCADIDGAMTVLMVGTLLGAIGFVLTLLYMCPCVSKRTRGAKASEASSEALERPSSAKLPRDAAADAPPINKMHRNDSAAASLRRSFSVAVRAGSARLAASASRRAAEPEAEAQLVAAGPRDDFAGGTPQFASPRAAAEANGGAAGAPGAPSGAGLAGLQAASSHFAGPGGGGSSKLAALQPGDGLAAEAAGGGAVARAASAGSPEGEQPSGSGGGGSGDSITARIRNDAAVRGRAVDLRDRREDSTGAQAQQQPPPPLLPAGADPLATEHSARVTNYLFDSAHIDSNNGGSARFGAAEGPAGSAPQGPAAVYNGFDAEENGRTGEGAAPAQRTAAAPQSAASAAHGRGPQAWWSSRRHAPPAAEPALVASGPEPEPALGVPRQCSVPTPLGESLSADATSETHVLPASDAPATDAAASSDFSGSMFLPPPLSPEISLLASAAAAATHSGGAVASRSSALGSSDDASDLSGRANVLWRLAQGRSPGTDRDAASSVGSYRGAAPE